MEKSAISLIAALGAVLPISTANAAVPIEEARRVLHATSVADLLDPIPNALGVMNALAGEPKMAAKGTEVAQIYFGFGHHHHHHHHHWYHHHHHHYWHHHHHHHYYYYNNDE